MVFNSLTFIIFFAIVLLLHRVLPGDRSKKINLLVASYLFYAGWNPPFVALLFVSTVVDWSATRAMARTDSLARRRLLLLLSLSVNLGLLGYFKYGGFLLESFVHLCAVVGLPFKPAAPSIILPVGISFYTFQTLSYTIDVYRRDSRPWPSALDFALYVAFFPQLVAGPIVRSHTFLPQCAQLVPATARQLAWGLHLLLLGMFQKVFVADGFLAPIADAVYNNAALATRSDAWLGTLAFAGQIFFDFSGYSTAAIGVALCLGFSLPQNFRFPYAAIGFSDFWQRWHISLSSWLRDYLYIPLGGNRHGPTRTQLHLMATMLLGGLWHGASWRFVFWGFLHGLYLVVERQAQRYLGGVRLFGHWSARAMLGLFTFFLVCLTWVPFRAGSFADSWRLLDQMGVLRPWRLFGGVPVVKVAVGAAAKVVAKVPAHLPTNLLNPRQQQHVLLIIGALLVGHWLLRDMGLERAWQRAPTAIRLLLIALMFVAILIAPGDDRAFIYFQF